MTSTNEILVTRDYMIEGLNTFRLTHLRPGRHERTLSALFIKRLAQWLDVAMKLLTVPSRNVLSKGLLRPDAPDTLYTRSKLLYHGDGLFSKVLINGKQGFTYPPVAVPVPPILSFWLGIYLIHTDPLPGFKHQVFKPGHLKSEEIALFINNHLNPPSAGVDTLIDTQKDMRSITLTTLAYRARFSVTGMEAIARLAKHSLVTEESEYVFWSNLERARSSMQLADTRAISPHEQALMGDIQIGPGMLDTLAQKYLVTHPRSPEPALLGYIDPMQIVTDIGPASTTLLRVDTGATTVLGWSIATDSPANVPRGLTREQKLAIQAAGAELEATRTKEQDKANALLLLAREANVKHSRDKLAPNVFRDSSDLPYDIYVGLDVALSGTALAIVYPHDRDSNDNYFRTNVHYWSDSATPHGITTTDDFTIHGNTITGMFDGLQNIVKALTKRPDARVLLVMENIKASGTTTKQSHNNLVLRLSEMLRWHMPVKLVDIGRIGPAWAGLDVRIPKGGTKNATKTAWNGFRNMPPVTPTNTASHPQSDIMDGYLLAWYAMELHRHTRFAQ